jgi:hypothetical protein
MSDYEVNSALWKLKKDLRHTNDTIFKNSRKKVFDNSLKLLVNDLEIDICYVQREAETRENRQKFHKEYLKQLRGN